MRTSGSRNTAAIVVPRFNYGYGRPSLRDPHKLQVGTEYPLSLEGEGTRLHRLTFSLWLNPLSPATLLSSINPLNI